MNIIIPSSCDVGTFLPAGQHGLDRSKGRGDDTEPRGGAAGRRPHAGARGICMWECIALLSMCTHVAVLLQKCMVGAVHS